MAASLAPIAETWPENVLPPIGSRKSLARKIIARPFPLYGFIRFIGFYCLTKQIICLICSIRSVIEISLGPDGFSARSAIFCRYWTCTFSGRNDQAIGPRSSAIFTSLSMLSLRSKSQKICDKIFQGITRFYIRSRISG